MFASDEDIAFALAEMGIDLTFSFGVIKAFYYWKTMELREDNNFTPIARSMECEFICKTSDAVAHTIAKNTQFTFTDTVKTYTMQVLRSPEHLKTKFSRIQATTIGIA